MVKRSSASFARLQSALVLHRSSRLDKAEAIYRELLSEEILGQDRQTYAEAAHLLGLVEFARQNYPNAIEHIRHALASGGETAVWLVNLARCHLAIKEVIVAHGLLRKARLLEPNHPLVAASLAEIALLRGELEEARENAHFALACNPDFTEAAKTRVTVEAKLGDWKSVVELAASMLDKKAHQQSPYGPVLRTYLAIGEWLETADPARIVNPLAALSGAQPIPGDKQFVEGYRVFLARLCWFKQQVPQLYFDSAADTTRGDIFVFGDSHCLSLSHTKIDSAQGGYRIRPVLNVGAKAWHLANPGPSSHRSAFRLAVGRLPERSNVMLNMGEIDCRINEGILTASAKLSRSPESVARETAYGYVDAAVGELSRKTNNISLVTVPAPPRPTRESQVDVTQERLEALNRVVRAFNDVLRQESRKRGLGLVDTWRITDDGNGWSNGKYHLDGIHLAPHYLLAAAATR
jgi:hypothetical protein